MTKSKKLHPSFNNNIFKFRKKLFKILGESFKVTDDQDNILFYSKQKAFKLKEDIRIYSDKSCNEELLVIKTPQVLDISATYNIYDPVNDEKVGSLKREGIKSMLKDKWIFFSQDGEEIGELTEKSTKTALLSRFINLIPQKYKLVSSKNNMEVANINQHFNPFILKYTMNINYPDSELDRRLIIAAGILLSAIEGRQG